MTNLKLPEGFSLREEEDFVHLLYKDEPEPIATFSIYIHDPQVIIDTAEAYLRGGNNG